MRPYQMDPAMLPEGLRHVVVLDFRVRGDLRGLLKGPKYRADMHGEPVLRESRSIKRVCLHAWLTSGDVADPDGWTERDLWRHASKHYSDLEAVDPSTDDLLSEAVRTLRDGAYHLCPGVSAQGEPFVALPHPWPLYLNHGNGWNRSSLGLGCMWGAKDGTSAPRQDAFIAALWLAAQHGPLEVVTHRQSGGRNRRADPGKTVARYLGHAMRVLVDMDEGGPDIEVDPDTTLDEDSRPWPPDWRAAYNAARYGGTLS